ncbi:MAG: PQQ-binding-like beta-propeller repeat protein [Planctomycetes bacterium]|nr:PQQ-binding-like beta-propeller repeat protein [Planctomycetia bacterium]MBI3468504.1 PQQ-binding-like beta-propeller repeat protein [Planctomycetota bacterium]
MSVATKQRLRSSSAALGLCALVVALIALGFYLGLRHGLGDTELLGDRQKPPVALAPNESSAPAGWPQWRGLNRDGVSPETGLLTKWPEQGPAVLWRAASGLGYSGLAVAGGRLYTLLQEGDNEAVICLNAETGNELWRLRYAAKFVSDQGSGPRSTPTVEGNRVYTVGATGILHCLDAATGELIWRRDLIQELDGRVPEWGVSFSPLVDGDSVFTHPGGSAGNSLAAFDKYTGALRWKSLDDRPGYASPILTTAAGVRQVLFFTAEALVSVEPASGRLYWRYPWTTMMDCNIATPITTGEYVFTSSGYGRGCALLKLVPRGAGALGVEAVYEHARLRNHFSTSVLYEGHLYGFDETRLICMELLTGKVKWQARGFRKGSLLAADGHLIILGENGKLALADATPAGYRERASFRVSHYRCWTVPTLAGGKLYVRDEEQIACLDLRTARSTERVAGAASVRDNSERLGDSSEHAP